MQDARDRQLGVPAAGLSATGGHDARDYGRNAEPLPDLHVFSRLSELDEACAEELAQARARQETLEREIAELANRLAAPFAADAPISSTARVAAKPGKA